MADTIGREVLAALPFVQDLSAAIRAKLPPGANFAFFLYVPGSPEGRLLSIVTDHGLMHPQIAEWVRLIPKIESLG